MKNKLYVLIDTNDYQIVPLAVSYSRRRLYEIVGEKAIDDDYPTDSMQIMGIDLEKVEE